MSSSNRFPVLLGLISAAVACYLLGFLFGAALFLAAGVVLELSFWVQLFRRNR